MIYIFNNFSKVIYQNYSWNIAFYHLLKMETIVKENIELDCSVFKFWFFSLTCKLCAKYGSRKIG